MKSFEYFLVDILGLYVLKCGYIIFLCLFRFFDDFMRSRDAIKQNIIFEGEINEFERKVFILFKQICLSLVFKAS